MMHLHVLQQPDTIKSSLESKSWLRSVVKAGRKQAGCGRGIDLLAVQLGESDAAERAFAI